MIFKLIKTFLPLTLIFVTGCALLSPLIDRSSDADNIAKSGGFERYFIKTKCFTLTSYHRFRKPGSALNIYIEGDGSAWLGRNRLSDDPTPRNPLALELADIDPSPNVAYLARPGQYNERGAPECSPDYWSDKRFSEEVVASMDEAIDNLARKAKAGRINLVGYSGGAAIAVLIASRRTDVVGLRTVAGNLDPEALNDHHHVTPLSGSLDPIEEAQKIKSLPQRHFVGSRDTVVPSFIARSFVKRAGDGDYDRITIVEGATHAKGWRERWRELLSMPVY